MSTSAGSVECPSCKNDVPIEAVPQSDKCPECGNTIPDGAPTKIRMDVVENRLGELFGGDYSPAGGTDHSQEEISKPDRNIGALSDVLTDTEKGDVIEATIGVSEDQTTAKFYVISHEQDVSRTDVDHRVSFVEKPRDDGWTRLYITIITESEENTDAEVDPWEVASVPYDIGGDKTMDARDFASNGWMIGAEIAN